MLSIKYFGITEVPHFLVTGPSLFDKTVKRVHHLHKTLFQIFTIGI